MRIFIVLIVFYISCFAYRPYYNGNVKFDISTYSSTSHEYVYDDGKKLSELIWEIQNIPLLGLELDLFSRRDIAFNLKYEIGVFSTDSKMDDYDWLKDYTNDWSDWSHHSNTKVRNLSFLDLNVRYKFLDKYYNKYWFITGYKIENRSFKAYDGTFIYTNTNSNDPNDFRQNKGTFSGLGISYSEKIEVLYFKTKFKRESKGYILNAALGYSPFVRMYNKDTHHFREFTNINIFDYTSMFQYSFGIDYKLYKGINISLEYERVFYKEAKGTTTRNYYNQGAIVRYDGAGVSSNSTKVTYLKLKFLF